MNMQELLTYVEELTFKSSMFGYDKDEVDIQLDKICDEVEAILKAKDEEIEALKSVPAETTEVVEEPTEAAEAETAASAEELAAALKREEALQAELAAVKEELAAAKEELAEALKNKQPMTTDEAYARYIKNADLLCKQLSDVESRKEEVIEAARQSAKQEKEAAQQQAVDIISEARKTAESVIKDAEAGKEEAANEARKIREESLQKTAEQQKAYDEIVLKKKNVIRELKKLAEDTASFMAQVEE